MMRDGFDEEEDRRRNAPMGDISPETIAAGQLDDDKPDSGTMDTPELGVSGDDAPPAPEPEPDTDWAQPDFPSASRSIGAALSKPNAQSDALSKVQEISSRRYTPSSGLSDDAIARARGDRRQQTQRNDVTRALQAWLLRKPFEPTPPDNEAGDLLQRRRLEQQDFERGKTQEMSVQAALAKALKGEKPAEMTPYQKAELDMRGKELGNKRDEKAGALEARKRTMLSLYPEHKADIDALTDIGDAQTLQTALEGRAGRESTQTHQDQAASTARDEREREARIASERELQKQIAFEKWKQSHQNLTAEQKTQLEGIEKSDEVLDTFEKGLGSVSGLGGKVAAKVPGVAGAIGAEGAEFPATREGTAIGLARGLEGGTARPGNVEIIQHMLPEASDADNIKAAKMRTIRAFVKNNREAFQRAAEQGGTELHPAKNPRVPPSSGGKTTPGGKPYAKKQKNTTTGAVRYLDENGNVIEETHG